MEHKSNRVNDEACMRREPWNRCDECGVFIPYDDFLDGAARVLLEPQSDLSEESYETLCKKHHQPSRESDNA